MVQVNPWTVDAWGEGEDRKEDWARLRALPAQARGILLDALTDADLSVRATCRWALGQMALSAPDAL